MTVAERLRTLIIFFILALIPVWVYAGWVTPDTVDNPGRWNAESNAIDGNTSTYASCRPPFWAPNWGDLLTMSFNTPITASNIRIMTDYGYGSVSSFVVQVSDGSTWTTVHSGDMNDGDWTEISFTSQIVNAVRVAYYFDNKDYNFFLYEVEVYESTGSSSVPVPVTGSASKVEEQTAILHGTVADDGGEPCDFYFEYGPDTGYGSSTTTRSSRQTGEDFTDLISGLTDGQTYHYRAVLVNSAGTGYGADQVFSTSVPAAGWVSPSGSYGGWEDEHQAYDDDLLTLARENHEIGEDVWSPYLYLTHASMNCDQVRFYARGDTGGGERVTNAEVDVYLDTGSGPAWVNVYSGSAPHETWSSHTFTPGTVTEARIRFRASTANVQLYFQVFEFNFYRLSLNTPTLAWTGEANYSSDGLDPETGDSKQVFEYRVEYSDGDGDAPSSIQVYVDRNGDGDYAESGEVITMNVDSSASDATKRDGIYTNGEWYYATTTIPCGANTDSCTYYFYATDGADPATGPPTTTVNAPDVLLNIGEGGGPNTLFAEGDPGMSLYHSFTVTKGGAGTVTVSLSASSSLGGWNAPVFYVDTGTIGQYDGESAVTSIDMGQGDTVSILVQVDIPADDTLKGQYQQTTFTVSFNPSSSIVAYTYVKPDLYVKLIKFDVEITPEGNVVTWVTGEETDNAGFNLFRRRVDEGYVKLNDLMIPPSFNGLTGAYSYADKDVINGVKYLYLLEDIDVYGTSTFHGPIDADLGYIEPDGVLDDWRDGNIDDTFMNPVLGAGEDSIGLMSGCSYIRNSGDVSLLLVIGLSAILLFALKRWKN